MNSEARKPSARALSTVLLLGGLIFCAGPAAADPYTDIQAQLDGGKLRQAQAAAQKLLAAGATDCKAWALLADANRRLTDIEGALKACKEGLAGCPGDKTLLRMAATLYDEREQYGDAATYYNQLWAVDSSDPFIGSRLGNACFKSDRCDDGRKVFDALLTAHPDRVEDRWVYAQLLSQSCKDHAAAEAQFQKLIAAQPKRLAFHCSRAFNLVASGQADAAVKAVQAGLAAVPTNNGCLYAAWGRALETSADSLYAQGKVVEARAIYQTAVEPLQKGQADALFGNYCKNLLADVLYKQAPMEELKP